MLSQTLIALATAALALGAPSTSSEHPTVRKRIQQCSGIPGGLSSNGTELSANTETKVVYNPQGQSNHISAIFYYNGHGGAPCDPKFALGITKNETAPSNVLDAGWVDRVAIGGNQGNALVLDSHIASDHYNVFFVQYDPATGDVIADPSTQLKGKICYRAIYPLQDNPCDA